MKREEYVIIINVNFPIHAVTYTHTWCVYVKINAQYMFFTHVYVYMGVHDTIPALGMPCNHTFATFETMRLIIACFIHDLLHPLWFRTMAANPISLTIPLVTNNRKQLYIVSLDYYFVLVSVLECMYRCFSIENKFTVFKILYKIKFELRWH